jgi:D-alanyl-lipoteichoic acid acyltransferase DltB (MBOAT superfamily)
MTFSSPKFIFIYLPIVFLVYFLLNRQKWVTAGKYWLVIASLVFYGQWSVYYIPLLLFSICFNFWLGRTLASNNLNPIPESYKNILLGIGIAANVILLGYYKYSNFFIENFNSTFSTDIFLQQIVLPLGISFYTFTQIAFLVDCRKKLAREYNFINYALFVTFFPHLIAGPILHHKEMMSQFQSKRNLAIHPGNVLTGLFIFGVGLFKKVVIADTLAVWADAGFASGVSHDFFSAWTTSLSYTFQLYFDFSGYCDMAIGAALLFNIWLPTNFNSPYKSLDIQDFWRRWHMTLSRYLRDYLYVPLGGNRCGRQRLYLNLMVTFILGGLWHGASWMFIIWGALHGGAIVAHRVWKQWGLSMPNWAGWLCTFIFVNITWVFFRATSVDDAVRILRGMIDFNSIQDLSTDIIPTAKLAWGGTFSDQLLEALPAGMVAHVLPILMIAACVVIIRQKNSFELIAPKEFGITKITGISIITCLALYASIQSRSAVFLYFNF